jgi:hypothetical protein
MMTFGYLVILWKCVNSELLSLSAKCGAHSAFNCYSSSFNPLHHLCDLLSTICDTT